MNGLDTARYRYGIVTRAQLRALGFTRDKIIGMVRRGEFIELHPGVYRIAGSPVTPEQTLFAAVLAAGAGALASHRAAAWVWELLPDEAVEISVPSGRSARLTGVTVHRVGDLNGAWAGERRGIPVTSPMRALVDLGAVAEADVVRDALERGLIARYFTVAVVAAELERVGRRGRPGTAVLRDVLQTRALGDARPDGMLEPHMAELFDAAGIERPQFQYEIRDAAGRLIARVDFAYVLERLAIEVDGWSFHGSPEAMTSDLRRQNRLVALGWTVLRFTWWQVMNEPARVAREIASVLFALRSA